MFRDKTNLTGHRKRAKPCLEQDGVKLECIEMGTKDSINRQCYPISVAYPLTPSVPSEVVTNSFTTDITQILQN